MQNPDIKLTDASIDRYNDSRIDVDLNASGSYWKLESPNEKDIRLWNDDGDGLYMTRGEAFVLGRELLKFATKGHLREGE